MCPHISYLHVGGWTSEACRDQEFWRWSTGVQCHVFNRTEDQRRWGMVCPHPECRMRRANGEVVNCSRNSRRLPEIPGHVTRESQRWLRAADSLQLHDCQDDQSLLLLIATMLRSGQDQYVFKAAHFGLLPHRFCKANSLEGCLEIFGLMQRTDFASQTPLAQRWINQHGSTVVQVDLRHVICDQHCHRPRI